MDVIKWQLNFGNHTSDFKSNSRRACSGMISDQTALHSVQLPFNNTVQLNVIIDNAIMTYSFASCNSNCCNLPIL